jgi:putative acetyltransferase
MEIRPDNDLTDERVLSLLRLHLDTMAPTAPAESRHALDLSGLRRPDITFWCLWDGEALAGFGALKRLSPEHGEIKSMRTAPEYLRRGVAARMLAHIIDAARQQGFGRLSLETGSMAFFKPCARALRVVRLHALRTLRRLQTGSAESLHDDGAVEYTARGSSRLSRAGSGPLAAHYQSRPPGNQAAQLGVGEVAPLPDLERTELDVVDAHAAQLRDAVTEGGGHQADLPVQALRQHDAEAELGDPRGAARQRHLAVDAHAARHATQEVVVTSAC